MQVSEILEGFAYKRKGISVSRKYRCTSGPRKGRVMSSPAACNAPYQIKRAMTLKKTKSKLGGHGTFKSSRTKKFDPASRRVKSLNIRRR